MKIKLYADGKVNPLGLDFDDVRLSIKTELNEEIDSVNFNLYYSLIDLENNQPFLTVISKTLTAIISARDFKETQKIFWNARITIGGKEYVSDMAFFETGIKKNKNNETWIENPTFNKSVAEFVKNFTVDKKPNKARLYIVGLGYYSSKINGKKTDEYFFKPLLTDFDYRLNIDNPDYDEDNFYNDKKSVCYDAFDITDLIITGENQLSVLLGTGWYCNDDKLITDPCDRFGTPKLFFEIHLYFGNSVKIYKSDDSVLVRNTDRSSQLFAGDKGDFTAKKNEFIPARLCAPPAGKLVCPKCEHDKVIEELAPLSVSKTDGVIEYDFGKNHSGSISLKVKGERGKKITIQYYEVKDENGLNPHTSEWIAYDVTGEKPVPIDVLYQKDEYILSGGVDEIEPLFHFNCYRYVTVRCEGAFEIISIKSLFICTDVQRDGYFSCSNDFINDFYNAFVLTQRDNMHSGIPSDCPHREKLPYTGDGSLATEPTMYTFNAEQFYRKWLKDVLDAQGNNGWVPYTAPNIGGAGGYWWSNVITDLPLKIYAFTGDKTVIEKALNPALKYLEFCNAMHGGAFIIRRSFIRWYIGEWLNPETTKIDVDFMNTLAYFKGVSNVIKMCEILGDNQNKLKLEIIKDNIAKAINTEFYDPDKKTYCGGMQCADLLPVIYGICGDDEKIIWDNLVDKYRKTERFDTGIILTPVLLETLTERGEEELCYKLFTAKGKPSFNYMLDGETTLSEHWNKTWPSAVTEKDGQEIDGGGDVSHCHPMFGSVVAWMYKHIAGLNLSELYKNKVIIRPRFIKYICNASAEKITPYGKVSVLYQTEKGFKMKVKIPFGLTGEIILPINKVAVNGVLSDGKITLGGGEYIIEEQN